MNDYIIVQNIIRECIENDGFLVKLHTYNVFDNERYKSLIDHLSHYRTMLDERPEMSRSVAGCIMALQQEIDNQINLSSQGRKSDKEAADIAVAYEELWQLINDIMKI
jgi:hypothetical protein